MTSSRATDDAQNLASKNFNLLEPDFDEMVRALKMGSNDLYQKVIFAHFSDCTAYLKKSLKITSTEAYDASVDALVLFGKKLKHDKIKYGNLRFLFTQMAKQAFLQKKRKAKPFIELEVAGEVPEQIEGPDPDTLAILDKAWEHLEKGCQRLLRAVFYDNTPIKDLAVLIGKKPPTLRKQKQRCMEKLQQIFRTLDK